MAEIIVNEVIDAPAFGHGESVPSPNPAASMTSNNETAVATTVPAATAGHDTADVETVLGASVGAGSAKTRSVAGCIAMPYGINGANTLRAAG